MREGAFPSHPQGGGLRERCTLPKMSHFNFSVFVASVLNAGVFKIDPAIQNERIHRAC